jgi:DNA invertase Pin-like site-specific DNA recombinase
VIRAVAYIRVSTSQQSKSGLGVCYRSQSICRTHRTTSPGST